jgi:hypothetical protein
MKKLALIVAVLFAAAVFVPALAAESKAAKEEKAEDFWKVAAAKEELQLEKAEILKDNANFEKLAEKEKMIYLFENCAKHPKASYAAFEYAENHQKERSVAWLWTHPKFAEWVANHPRAAEILKKHPKLAMFFAKHPKADEFLKKHPELKEYLKAEWLEHKKEQREKKDKK